jgi:hypothetical protein
VREWLDPVPSAEALRAQGFLDSFDRAVRGAATFWRRYRHRDAVYEIVVDPTRRTLRANGRLPDVVLHELARDLIATPVEGLARA